MAGPAILLEIITYIFQCTPPTCDCDKPTSDDVCRFLLKNFFSFRLYCGSTCIIMLNGYDIIHEAFTKQADVFTDRPQLFAPLIGVSKGTGEEFKHIVKHSKTSTEPHPCTSSMRCMKESLQKFRCECWV